MNKLSFTRALLFFVSIFTVLALFACDGIETDTQSYIDTTTEESTSQAEEVTTEMILTDTSSDETTRAETIPTEITTEIETETETEVETELIVRWDFAVEVESGREARVLQLTDIQILERGGADNTESFYKRYVRQLVEKTDPDLIIITGDLVYGKFDHEGNYLLDIIEFMDSFEIPWAPVFGNHDNESNMGVDWQCEQFENSEYCLFKQRDITGNGNYIVAIIQNNIPTRAFFMLDSNGCGNKSDATAQNSHFTGSAGLKDDQIGWFVAMSRSIKAVYPNVKQSLAFHIQPYVFSEAFAKYDYDPTLKDNGDLVTPIDLGLGGDNGDFGYLGRPIKSQWDKDHYMWNAAKRAGIDSIFVGHEHCNSLSIVFEGIRLQYGQKSSLYDRANYVQRDGSIIGYYSAEAIGDPLVGGTLIELSESGEISNCRIVLCE